MRFDAPFKLGPFSIDAEGRLTPYEPASAPAFLFRWHDRVVRARLVRGSLRASRTSSWTSQILATAAAIGPVRPRP